LVPPPLRTISLPRDGVSLAEIKSDRIFGADPLFLKSIDPGENARTAILAPKLYAEIGQPEGANDGGIVLEPINALFHEEVAKPV
jgi:hypothetical protein